jgi:hypothetical protein
MKTSFSSWTKNWSPTFGDDTLTEMQNLQIVKSVQLYIKGTKRFANIWSQYTLPFFLINPVASISHTRMIKKNVYAFLYYIISCLLLCIISVPGFFFIFHKNLFIMLYIVIYYCWRMYYCNYLLCGEHPCKLL